MPRFPVLSVNRSLLLLLGLILSVALFPVRSLAQSPSITDVRNSNNGSDYTGAVGQDVKIIGSGFGSSQGSSAVTFNGTAATVTNWTATALYTTVPSGATSGDLVVTAGGVSSNAVSFTVIAGPNVVTLRNPINANDFTGAVGQAVKIVGGGFGTSPGGSTITFNGTTATATSWAANAIYVPVPSGATSGNLVVTVGGIASNAISFTVIAGPNILTVRNTSNVDITSAAVGTAVRILGGGFGTPQGGSTVTFNGATATPTSWAADRIDTTVPSGATTGNLIVTVGGTAGNAVSFTVPPVITSISPGTGTSGTAITITGTGFGATPGTSTVQINGASATPGSWSDASIGVTVPSGATPQGNVYVTVSGVASNGVSFQANPYISSLSPSLVSEGTAVTVSGSSFGATQGTSTVSFNGTAGAPASWSNTQIVVPVPSGATSGNLIATVGGQASNGAAFTIVDPPGITSSIWPAANGSGWYNLNVTVTFMCTPGDVALANCSGPQTFTTEGLDFLATGEAEGINGNTASATVTLDIDKTKPTLTITSPADGDSTSSSSLTVSGTLSDTLSGTDGVTCNGSSTTLTSGAFSCNISLDVGVNLVVIRGTDIAGNVSAANYHITRTGSLGTPTSLVISPAEVNMVAGDVQRFNVVDQDGHVRADATWAVDDTNLATLPDGDTPELTAVGVGDVTLTATVGSVTAEASIHVLSGTSLTDGTIRWSAPSQSGYTLQRIVQAQPAENGPSLYAIQRGSANETLVQTFTADGYEMWEVQSRDSHTSYAVPAADGGMVLSMHDGEEPYLMKFDARTGSAVWRYGPTNVQLEAIAAGRDGTVYAVVSEPPDFEYQLLALDGETGSPRYRIKLPKSGDWSVQRPGGCYHSSSSSGWDTDGEGYGQGLFGTPALSEDGELYLGYSSASYSTSYQDTNSDTWCDSTDYEESNNLLLLTVQPTGQYTSTSIHETEESCSASGYHPSCQMDNSSDVIHPGTVIPDGEGGALLSWYTLFPSQPHIAYLSGSGVSDYVPPATAAQMVLGEDGVAFGGGGQKVFAFAFTSSSTLWSYDAPSGNSVSIIASAAENGLTAKLTNGSNVDTVIRFDDEGTPIADTWSGFTLTFTSRNMWIGMGGAGELAALAAPPAEWALSSWPTPAQNGQRAAEPPLRLAAQSDYEDTFGRHVMYWLLTPSGALANDKPYTVFEYQTDLALAPPYGQSPREYWSPTSSNIAKFDDALSPLGDSRTHVSKQMFAFGAPGEQRYVVKRLERKLATGYSRLPIPVLNLRIAPGQQATINGHSAPYMGPWGTTYPEE